MIGNLEMNSDNLGKIPLPQTPTNILSSIQGTYFLYYQEIGL